MRILISLLSLLCLATGCSAETSSPLRAEPPRVPTDLTVKLTALMADPCFRAPTTQKSEGCEKYVTQLSGVSRSLRELADNGLTKLAGSVDQLDSAIASYWQHRCSTTNPSELETCTQALQNLAESLTVATNELSTYPTST